VAIKKSTLDAPSGPQLWLYTPVGDPDAPGGQTFPGLQSANNCGGEAGDTLVILSVKPKAPGGAFVADSRGYRPHLAIYPGSNQMADPNHVTKGRNGQENKLTAVPGWPWGNDQTETCIRINFGTVYLRWGCGSIQVEGGDGPGGDAGTLGITYLWDRPKVLRDRAGWGQVVLPPITHRLTMYKVVRGTTIQRPTGASRIWTPDNVTITGNTGSNSFDLNFTNASSIPLDLGPADSVTMPGTDVTSVIFELDL